MRFIVLLSVLTSGVFFACGSPSPAGTAAEAESLYSRAIGYRYSFPDSVLWCAQQIDSLHSNSARVQAQAQICYGIYHNHISQYRLAEKNYNAAVTILSELGDDTLMASAHTGLGNSYKNLARFDDALDHFIIALALYEKNHHRNTAGVHVNISQVYQMKEDERSAKEHLQVAMQSLNNDKANPAYLIAAHTLANLYGMAGKLDSALLVDRECLRICDSLGEAKLKSPFLDNIALCMMYSGQLDSSRIYFMRCMQMDSIYGETKQVADSYSNLSGLAMEEKNYRQAEAYALLSLKKCRETGYAIGERNAWSVLANVYTAIENFSEALRAKDSVNAVSRRIINEKTEARIAELEAVYESEKQAQQIAEQNEDILIQQIIIVAGVIILVLAVIITLLYVKSFRRKKETELGDKIRDSELRAQAAVYESEMKERTRIARDLHDSVGQMLSVIKMLISTGAHDHPEVGKQLQKAMDLTDKAISEVRSISHNLLPEEINFGVANAIQSLRDAINLSGTMKMEVSIDSAAEFNTLSAEQVLSIYRITQEVTANMLRHSKGTLIRFELRRREAKLFLVLSDNGTGLSEDAIAGSEGIGWKNIRARVALLNGSMQIHSQPQQGTRLEIIFEV